MKLFDKILFAPEDGGGAAPTDGSSPPASPVDGGGSTPPAGPAEGGLRDASPDPTSALPDNIMNGDDLDEVVIPEAPEPEVPVKPAEVKPAETKKDEPALAPKVPEPAKPTESKSAEAKPTQTEVKPATPAPPSADILAQLDQNKGALIKHLAGERFALSQEETDLLDTNPTAAIPQIMARTFYEAQVAAITQIRQMVPQLINEVMTGTNAAKAAEDGFYAANSDLNRDAHGETVGVYAKAFRAANPKASKEDAYKFVANAVRAQFGLTALVAGAPPAAPPKPTPFAPARGGVKVVSQTPVDESPFSGMGKEFDDE